MVTPPLPITGGCASWAGIPSLEPFPEPTDYSYRKIVIQKFPITLAHGACMPAHTRRTQEGLGVWPVAPWAKGTQEGGCTPLAPRMPLAPPPLPISIKNCSAALREAWPGARVGFRPVARALLSDLRPVGYRLRLEAGLPSHWEGTGCARSLADPPPKYATCLARENPPSDHSRCPAAANPSSPNAQVSSVDLPLPRAQAWHALTHAWVTLSVNSLGRQKFTLGAHSSVQTCEPTLGDTVTGQRVPVWLGGWERHAERAAAWGWPRGGQLVPVHVVTRYMLSTYWFMCIARREPSTCQIHAKGTARAVGSGFAKPHR